MLSTPLAVIDIGSNSGRVVVLRPDGVAGFDPLAESRVALRLVRGLDRDGALDADSIEHALIALADFRAVAEAAGVDRIVAVATAAVREATNGHILVQRITDDIGLDVRILDGGEEAHFAVMGAIYGLDCDTGLMVDVGGGSMQVAQFANREPGPSWSLPLGALRLSDAFLTNDPPTDDQLRRLSSHVVDLLVRAGVPPLKAGEVLVGTGGTARNLARIDRKATAYPIPRVHGYQLTLPALKQVTATVALRSMRERRAVPGLHEDRADSIVGGAVAIQALMETLRAPALVVSGQGLREGVGYSTLGPGLPTARAVRVASLAGLARRFGTWNPEVAERRQAIARAVFAAFGPQTRKETRQALDRAAMLLDIGRGVDYYRRFDHAADIVCTADLDGLSHRAIALLAAVLRFAEAGKVRLKSSAPLLNRSDKREIERASATLALADHLEQRCRPGVPLQVSCQRVDGALCISAPIIRGASVESIQHGFEALTGTRLRIACSSAVAA